MICLLQSKKEAEKEAQMKAELASLKVSLAAVARSTAGADLLWIISSTPAIRVVLAMSASHLVAVEPAGRKSPIRSPRAPAPEITTRERNRRIEMLAVDSKAFKEEVRSSVVCCLLLFSLHILSMIMSDFLTMP